MANFREVTLILLINVCYHTMNQMFVPTLPIHITQLGGSEIVVGFLVGLLSLGSLGAKAYFGKLATRRSNLLVLRIGLVLATAVLVLYLPPWGFSFLALVRLVQSIGLGGYVTGGQGLLADQSKKGNRGLLFGLFAATIGLGMMLGPLLGTYLMENFGFSALIIGATIIVGLALGLSFLIPAQAQDNQAERRNYQPHPPWENRNVLVISGSMFFGATMQGATMSMLALHALDVGIVNSSLFFLLFALFFTLTGALAGHLSDKLGRAAMVVPGFVLLISGLLSLASLQGLVTLALGGLATGAGLGVVNAVLLGMIPDYSLNPEDAANDLAFFSNAFDAGIVVGSLGLSWLVTYSYNLFWLGVAILTSLGLVVFLKFNPEKAEKLAA